MSEKFVFMKSGNSYRIASKESLDLHEVLPARTYVVKRNPNTGEYYLEVVDSFEVPSKIYGDSQQDSDRIISTFEDRENSTGVLLCGEKGSGKTLLSKLISITLLKKGIPTIIIDTNFSGPEFNTFIQSIEQPSVIIFDEFEKTYDDDGQEAILTLFDGVFSAKHLYLITCNNKYRIDSNMKNRPGRIYYMMEYEGLDQTFIHDYCEDKLKYPEHIDEICKYSLMFSSFNFDMMKAIVEEINRYNEPISKVIRMLNTKIEFSGGITYDVKLISHIYGDIPTYELCSSHVTWRGDPLSIEYTFDFDSENNSTVPLFAGGDCEDVYGEAPCSTLKKSFTSKRNGSSERSGQIHITYADIQTFDPLNDKIVYKNPDGDMVILNRHVHASKFNWL
jgi:hypothetical protein